ncbi:unnamed protein product [Hermetia illucens]|uniref:Uncharacterized protein n=1 Tax=Hermetia illucens TaxID=343691 RepID=A0A7R8UV01_HERIL|nr:unnamed protein product [Hermetia illucens]
MRFTILELFSVQNYRRLNLPYRPIHLLLNVLNISTWSFVLTRQFRLLAICELSEVYCEFKCRCTTRIYPCRYFILTLSTVESISCYSNSR